MTARQRITKRSRVYQGHVFDSRDEMERYIDLRCREIRGEISSLHIHVRFQILPQRTGWRKKQLKTKVKMVPYIIETARHYSCDFLYIDNTIGAIVVEDVKSSFTKGFTDYSLRRACMVNVMLNHMDHRPNSRRWIFRECEVKKNSFKTKDR